MAEKRIVAVDSQRLSTMQSCTYQFHLRFGPKQYVPLTTPDFYERGDLIHVMLAQYYKLKKYRSRWNQNHKSHADIVQSCIIAGRVKAAKMELDIAEVELCILVFMQYTDFWENDGWDDVRGVEQTGAKILYEDDEIVILYEVKVDLIIGLSNAILPVDHKSTKSHRAPNELSNQFKGYCWFLGVNNFLVNEVGFQKTVPPEKKFQRHVLSFPNDIIDEWVENSVWWIKFTLKQMDEGYFPHNYTSCDKYNGCDYKQVCMTEREAREFRLVRNYKEANWDVGAENL